MPRGKYDRSSSKRAAATAPSTVPKVAKGKNGVRKLTPMERLDYATQEVSSERIQADGDYVEVGQIDDYVPKDTNRGGMRTLRQDDQPETHDVPINVLANSTKTFLTPDKLKPRPLCRKKLGFNKYCNQPTVPGTSRCPLHGLDEEGASLPESKGAEIELRMPGMYANLARKVINHPGLLSLRRHISVLEALYQAKLRSIENSPSEEMWMELAELYAKFKYSSDKEIEKNKHRFEMALKRGCENADATKQVRELTTEIANLVKLESNRLKEMGQMITKNQALTLVNGIINAITETIPDYETRKRLADRVAIIAGAIIDPGDSEQE